MTGPDKIDTLTDPSLVESDSSSEIIGRVLPEQHNYVDVTNGRIHAAEEVSLQPLQQKVVDALNNAMEMYGPIQEGPLNTILDGYLPDQRLMSGDSSRLRNALIEGAQYIRPVESYSMPNSTLSICRDTNSFSLSRQSEEPLPDGEKYLVPRNLGTVTSARLLFVAKARENLPDVSHIEGTAAPQNVIERQSYAAQILPIAMGLSTVHDIADMRMNSRIYPKRPQFERSEKWGDFIDSARGLRDLEGAEFEDAQSRLLSTFGATDKQFRDENGKEIVNVVLKAMDIYDHVFVES